MNKIKILQVCFLIALVCCSVSIAEETNLPSLAILVYCDGGNQDLADKLQPLIEAEASLQWEGTLVERAAIDKLLDEMKLTRSGLSDPNNQLQFGKMITMDCLLTIRVNINYVKATFSQFPSTTIIHEKEYTKRLEPQSISVNIVTNAIKAYREHNRDPQIPQISIGSFYGVGLSKKYFNFGRDINVQLREKLIRNKNIIITERLLPSDLLSEFELARSGITQYVAQNFSSPSSDILLYGEFKAKPEQDLDKPAAELDFTLFIVSPTSLCESKKIEFSCYSNEPGVITEKAAKFIEQSAKEVRTKLAAGSIRTFSKKEYDEFKKQAFRLMPAPPSGDNYSKSQMASIEELEPALHMLECTMLFNSDDIQIIVCTGNILHGMFKGFRSNSSSLEKEVIYKTAADYIERAYLLDNNPNTRYSYYKLYIDQIKPSIEAAEHIWNTRKTEEWADGQVLDSFDKLIIAQNDINWLRNNFIKAAKEYGNENAATFSNILPTIRQKIYNSKNDPEIIKEIDNISNILQAEDSISLRFLGHMLYIDSYYQSADDLQKEFDVPPEFAEHFRAAINMLIEMPEEYKYDMISFHLDITYLFKVYEKVVAKYNLEDDSANIYEKLLTYKLQNDNPLDIVLSQDFINLLPELYAQGKYEKGYGLLSGYIENKEEDGGSISDSTRLLRQLNHFHFAMQNRKTIELNQFQQIKFDNTTEKVLKLISAKNYIYGIGWNHVSGTFFILSPKEEIARIMKQIEGTLSDIAITGKYIGIATHANGFYLLDTESNNIKNFSPDNSNFPSSKIEYVCSLDNNFILGIRSRTNYDLYIYLLEPDTYIIKELDSRTGLSSEIRTSINLNKNAHDIYSEENKSILIKEINNTILRWSKRHVPNLSESQTKKGIREITVQSYNKKNPVINNNFNPLPDNNVILSYTGIELSYVYDFTLWNEQLVLATGNGLYISKPGSNKIHCLISSPKLIFYCLYAFDDLMYIGTNEGFYCVGTEKFLEMVKQVEQTD